jgi:hypothetical protein
VNRITINTRSYWLTADQDVVELKKDVVQAVRSGGDLVTFQPFEEAAVSELVTVHSSVTFADVQPIESTAADEVDLASFDPEDYTSI